MLCSVCGEEKKNKARGVCNACYMRKRTKGTYNRTYGHRIGLCSVVDCDQQAFAKNLCSLHYARQMHPLIGLWRTFKRTNENYPAKWERFEGFLADLGEKRTPKDKLDRRDVSEPHSKENTYWRTPKPNERKDYFTPEARSEYVRNWTLQRKFGINTARYEEIKKSQGGKCAICRCEESFINKRSGVLQELSVDHCHNKLHVRGLLCVRCNRMIGYARDNADIMRRAIGYLEYHDSLVGSDSPPE